MSSNWQRVVEALAARRQMRVAGALRPATALGYGEGTLKIGFDADHETLRERCAGPLNKPIESALAELAGREIRCEYVSTGEGPTGRKRPLVRPPAALSAAEKADIQKDPTVRAVLDRFGGEIIDIRRDAPPPEPG